MSVPIRGIIFDLDGVITDTAEYHFLAWKRLADEERIEFTRAENEALRGVSRRASLAKLLKGRVVTDNQAEEMMARKNGYYQTFLANITPADLLPGVQELLTEIRAAGCKTAIASASRNAPDVVARLGIRDQFDVLAHGGSVTRQKPAPDLFLYTARQLGLAPQECLVVEDAEAGIAAAHAAGMVAVGLGPPERVGAAELILSNLDGATLAILTHSATWRVGEPQFNSQKMHHRETIFTHGNGLLSTRGTFEERYPGNRQATFVHGVWDDVPIGFTELANVPDWTAVEIWVDGVRFDMQAGSIQDYARYLDLRTGTLHRRLIWSPTPDSPVEITFERFTSLADEHVLALRVSVTPLENSANVKIRSYIDSHVENQGLLHWDRISQKSELISLEANSKAMTSSGALPSDSAASYTPSHERLSSNALSSEPLTSDSAASQVILADLAMRTRSTGKTLGLAALFQAPGFEAHLAEFDAPGCPGALLHTPIDHGQTCALEKFTAIYRDRDAEHPLAAAQARAKAAAQQGYSDLHQAQKAAWGKFWSDSDVIIEGDDEAQLALRHALFQLRIAAPTHDDRVSIGAKTLSGFGYRGHVFWDNEIFVVPFFTFTQPEIARNMLLYRYHTLPGARRKAAANGWAGAQFPWESAETGDEVTPTWVPHFDDPTLLIRIWTGDIQIHISADIAYAMHQFWRATGDDDFWIEAGIPVLLETAVFWGERAEPEGERFAIRDVIGPDEYHDHVDNNQFTNHIIRWHLRTALEALDWLVNRHPLEHARICAELDLNSNRLAHWQRVIDGLTLLQDPETGLIEQFEGFYHLKDVDWPAYEGRTRSMQEILGIEGCAEHKTLKQADVIALLCLLGDQFDKRTWQTNWDYYVPITDHVYGSSLGPGMHAWAAARLGKVDEAYEHFMRAARADLMDVRGNAGDGIHAASAGGLWEALVFGFAGMRLDENGVTFDPRFPSRWTRVGFSIKTHGIRQWVDFHNEDNK